MMRLALTNFWLRHGTKRYLRWEQDVGRARTGMERMMRFLPPPAGSVIRERTLGGLHARYVEGPADGPVILWLHGGAYLFGSSATHAPMVAALARRAGAAAWLPDYRLAPEDSFPAAVEDCRAAWDALLAEGVAPGRIVLGGDSAGGGLAFALLHELVGAGEALPGAVVGFSPWVDLTGEAESITRLAGREAMLPIERIAEIREHYLAGADPRDPRASPIFGRFAGAPPVLILSSRHEALRDDARTLTARLREDGVPVTHEEWESVPHAWQLFQGWLPEADRALDTAAAFVKSTLGSFRSG